MAVIRHDPASVFSQLQNEINRLFDTQVSAGGESSGATAEWVPAVDIAEYNDRFVLEADVPGVDPSAIDITLENGVLSMSGSREVEVGGDDADRRRIERARGRFYRRFTLPDTVDADTVEAKGNNGVLQVVIPKRPQSQPRKIKVAAK